MSCYIEYYKEKDTDPMVFLQRFRCATEPIGGGTEQDEEGELVSWEAAVAAIEIAMKQLGWHPASEHPPVDKETGFSECVVGVMPGDTVGFPQYVRYQKNEFYDRWIYGYTGVPSAINIKRWCYPPKED